MPTQLSSLAARVAAVTTTAAALALTAVLPAIPEAAPVITATAEAGSAFTGLPAVAQPVTPVVTHPQVQPVAVATPLPAAAPTAKRATALSKAMSKIGKPYVWGASGPNAFDCSGLVSWAYKQVGVSLPRSSRAQAGVGTPVAKSALQPGDLVFFYRPVSHVGIYIGNGKIVHASTSGQPVKISDVSRMPFNSARRI